MQVIEWVLFLLSEWILIKIFVMKHFLLLLLLALTITFDASAQKFCYVDIDYIMASIPEFQDAQAELDAASRRWEGEMNNLKTDIDNMYRVYYAEEVLYTPEIKEKKLQEIKSKEKALEQYTQDKFGYKGELFTKRQELVKPIQDAVYEAIEKLANDKRFDFVLDKSASVTILYAKSSYDKSDLVLKYLSY